MKKIAVILANGFEEIEALTVVDVTRRAGFICDIVSISEEFVTGAHNVILKADKLYSNDINDYDMIVLPGGLPGGPYAEIKNQAKELLNQNEIVNIDWNALNGDGETNNLSIEFELQRLQETTLNKSSIVVLMHDSPTKQITAEALPQIILYLREQGYEFKNFYEIIK